MAPFWGASIRFAPASLLLFFVVLVRRLPFPRGKALVGAMLFGVLNVAAFFAFIYWGLLQVSAGLGSIVTSLVPLLTFLLAYIQGVETFRWRGALGALLAVGGIVVVFREQISATVPLTSLLALVAAASCAAEAAVVVKLFPKCDPITMNSIAMGIGSVLLLGLSFLSGEPWILPTKATTWYALGYLIFVGSSILFVLYVFVIKRWTASGTSYSFVFFPLVAITLGALLAREPVTTSLILGGALVLIGVYVGVLYQPRAKTKKW